MRAERAFSSHIHVWDSGAVGPALQATSSRRTAREPRPSREARGLSPPMRSGGSGEYLALGSPILARAIEAGKDPSALKIAATARTRDIAMATPSQLKAPASVLPDTQGVRINGPKFR